ncbi:MAG TPA: fluoride efflux transporter CrcB [Pyrinomonadaceae bacterium]|nr:fluoride efflux transporter CrcB [Pyrinomonadaceae bacterium]
MRGVSVTGKYLAVAVGGALGAVARYHLGNTIVSRFGAPFPTATFLINVSGSFVIGFFLALAPEKFALNPHLRLAVAVGFVGAYTTFSTFEYETMQLLETRRYLLAFLYVVLSFAVGLSAVWGGTALAHRVEGAFVTNGAVGKSSAHLAGGNDVLSGRLKKDEK